MPLRVQFARALTTAAVLGAFAASYPAVATEGRWFLDGWYPQGHSPAQAPVNREPLNGPAITDQNDASVIDQAQPNEVRFIQPGREAWLADCRQRIAQTQNSTADAKSRQTSTQRAAGQDVCQAHLDAHNERYIASIRDWVSSSGTTQPQVYMPIEYNFNDVPVQQTTSRSDTRPAQASLDPQLSRP